MRAVCVEFNECNTMQTRRPIKRITSQNKHNKKNSNFVQVKFS